MAFRCPKSKAVPSLTPVTSSSIRSFRDFFGGEVTSEIAVPAYPSRGLKGYFGAPYTIPRSLNRESPPFFVKGTNFEQQLTTHFAQLYKNTDSSDVSLYCGSNHEMIKAHQKVLSMGSLYFREALKFVPSKHPSVIVRHLSGHSVGKILDYIYLGHVSLRTETELNSFFSGAKYLQVVGILEGKYSLSR